MIERKNELLEVLKQDEAARRFLKHAIGTKGGEDVEPLKDIRPDAITKLESLGLFELIDHKHILKDEVELDEIQQILTEAVESKEVPKQVKLSGSPFLKREWLEKWETILTGNNALSYFSNQISPKVVGESMQRAKKAILLSLASVQDQFSDRGRVHVLMVGPPGTAKTALGEWLSYTLGIQSASLRTSAVGLTGFAGGNEIIPGILPQADGEAVFLDELDKLKREDMQGLLDAAASGSVVIHVGKIHARLSARVRIIAAANKMDNFPPEIVDRFDTIINMEEYSLDEEKEIASQIAKRWFMEKEGAYGEELKAYLTWNKNYVPTIGEEVRDKMQQIIALYIDLDENIRGSMRKKESIIRLAFTIAKLNRRELQPSDLIEAITLKSPEFNGGKLEVLKHAAFE